MDNFNKLLEDFKGNKDEIISKNPKIKSVELIEETMSLKITIEVDEKIEEHNEESLNNHLRLILKEFNISLEFKEKIKEIKDPIKTTQEVILKYNPSARVWLDDLKFNLEENKIEIIAPNRAIYISMTNNGLKDLIKERLGIEIYINCNDKECQVLDEDMEEFFISIEDEEKKLCKIIEIENEKLAKEEKREEEKVEAITSEENYSYGRGKIGSVTMLSDLYLGKKFTVLVDIFNIECKEILDEKKEKVRFFLYTLSMTDYSTSIKGKVFIKPKDNEEFEKNIKKGIRAVVFGDYERDDFSKTDVMMIKYIEIQEKDLPKDNAQEKRVELHLHTQMSAMDGVTSIDKFVERAAYWGHKAIAITDHGVVQGFPDAMSAGKKYDVKILYGMEGYMVNDREKIIQDYDSNLDYEEFVVFDIETTGFSYLRDKITEIGAVKIKNGFIVDRFSRLVNPECEIPERITEITGISNKMVENEPTIDIVIKEFYDFCKSSVLVAHNAEFDKSFIRKNMIDNGLEFNFPNIDTLKLARATVENIKNYKLGTLAKNFGVNLVNAHRAVNDAEATAEIFMILMDGLKKQGVEKFDEINENYANKEPEKIPGNHITILAKNLEGLKNLYNLISISNLDYFYRKPKLPKTLIEKHREGLLIGSACSSGELYDAIKMSKPKEEIEEIAKFYDYLEIHPISNNSYLIKDRFAHDENHLRQYNKDIYELGRKLDIPVVAAGDAHYLNPEDDILRKILMAGQKMKVSFEPEEFYFRSTENMLEEFSYLGDEIAYEVVVKNTNDIADLIEDIKPIPDGTFPPVIEGADEELKELTYSRAHEIYGQDLPEIVKARIEKELNSIIKNGYSVLYIISQKLVKKSNEDGYYVGSRGSVGSSLVATLSGITEVNPLPAHYYCKECSYSEFPEGIIGSGVDLENKNCPICGKELVKEGHNIPFEVFLGFDGDKEPDIDLNFASEYQAKAHKYTEDLFGEGYVFRAGTIGKLADKTAYGYVKKYFEERNIYVNPAEIERLVKGCVGVKRTSGQHPGGVMICPKYKDILDFTPIQYPADDKKSGVITTHFDYHSISGRILKLDILGHDTPTMLKMLEDFTGHNSENIRFDDEKVLELFLNMEPLKADNEVFKCPTGTLGIPEFGTNFVRQMLVETKPQNFSDLVRISGLSHGTDVWTNNAQDLVKRGKAQLSDVISTREDIMVYLISAGAENKMAFDTMEKVRKGKGLTEADSEKMSELDLPEWYIDSCQKIKYMFPKAHAVAYVMMSFRIAYYKLFYPEAFYATYFSMKLADFDGELIYKGAEEVKNRLHELNNLNYEATAKEKSEKIVLEVALEMYARGYKFLNVDIYNSEASRFSVEEGGVRMPLRALVGLGENVALNIVSERNKSKFISIEDFTKRTKTTKTVMEVLINHGCLSGLDRENQLSFF